MMMHLGMRKYFYMVNLLPTNELNVGGDSYVMNALNIGWGCFIICQNKETFKTQTKGTPEGVVATKHDWWRKVSLTAWS